MPPKGRFEDVTCASQGPSSENTPMNKFFTIGGVAAWLLLTSVSGKLWPVLSLPTILAVMIGGVIGVLLGSALSGAKRK